MNQTSINEILASNLRYWMQKQELTQMALAVKAGVSQKTISNYLNPRQRLDTPTGKEPSGKLTELDRPWAHRYGCCFDRGQPTRPRRSRE